MVLTHTTHHGYAHPFPTVTLAFFLRYYSPRLNPFSSHVLSTDTISSHVDAATGRLHTTRLHLKRSRLPSAIVKLLPASVTGGSAGGDKSSYVLETSVVDIGQGWMKTESRNLNFTGVLSVVEQQHYTAGEPTTSPTSENSAASENARPFMSANTNVVTTFSYHSSLGGKKGASAANAANTANASEEDAPSGGGGKIGGWLSGWGAKRIQSSIEAIASNKTDDQMVKSRDGMRMVLERLRGNGVVAVLKELRRREGCVFEQGA